MKNEARTILLLLGDIVMLAMAFWIMLYVAFFGKLNQEIIGLHTLPFTILSIIWILIFFIFNLYNPEASTPTIIHLRRMFIAFLVATALGAIFFYTISFFQIAPKTNLVIFGGTALVLFILWRRIFYNIFSSYFRKSVIFIIHDKNHLKQVNDLGSYMSANPQSGFVVAGTYDSPLQFWEDQDKVFSQIFIVSKEIWRDPENFKKLYNTKNEVLDLAYAYEDILGRVPIEVIDEGWFMHNVRSHKKQMSDLGKRISSIVFASLILILTSPFLLIAGFLIKLYDGGPILYSQIRIGKDGKGFKLYKFRSMPTDAEKNGPEWSSKDDSRATPVGRILRRLHIDELPQMLNVIKGNITLVGPRPERPEFVEKLEKEIPFYHLRHIISPGFTGWAQIKFRYAGNVMDSKEKFEYDLYYLKNRNIFIDFGIILRTIQIIFTH